VPKYGGTLTIPITTTINAKDFWTSASAQVYEQFMGADWTRGTAGSGVTDFAAGTMALEDSMGPILAESWTMPEPGVWKLNIRQGVRWQQTGTEAGRLLAGREMTADDVVDSFNWQIKEQLKSWIHVGQGPVAKAATIEKTGPWEVTIKTPVDFLTSWTWIIQGAGYHRVYPTDVERKYNHPLVYQGEGWPYQEAVGTGPYMVAEVVAGTMIKYVKNPDYWAKDLLGPGKGMQLPYIDTLVELSIPDRSTQLAAMRTGRIAYVTGLTRDEKNTELQLNPKLQTAKYLQTTTLTRFISMRTDKKDKPFSDIRVRQALMMATDFNAIKDGYYGGEAEIDVWPLNKNFAASGYVPLNEMPAKVQDLYKYDPEKAKQLLKEAGYPNGFKTSIIVSGQGSDVDDVSIFKDMWAKVGVELVLDVKELTVFQQHSD
jgi:peptide/nickel transport system substrate-binding protein